MRKKKSQKKKVLEDYPVNFKPKDAKPTDPLKLTKAEKVTADLTWDELDTVDDIIAELGEDGANNNIVSRKKGNHSQCEDEFNERPGNVYPEIIWYLLSQYIKPEDIGNFAGINKMTYALTKRESFWRSIYNSYCKNHPKLPDRLRIENSYQTYGLRQRVIRALYHTYDVFVKKVQTMNAEGRAHQLTRRRCVNVWFYKGSVFWSVYFKFKKFKIKERTETQDFITELGRIDANPDQDIQVLQVNCRNFHEVPPLMGMTLSSVTMVHSHRAIHQRLFLEFNTGSYTVGKDILPECTVVLGTVLKVQVYDWWHPKYPHFDNKTPTYMEDDEVVPMLKKDFFEIKEGDFV